MEGKQAPEIDLVRGKPEHKSKVMEPSMFMPTPQLSQHKQPSLRPRPPDVACSSLPGLPGLQDFWRFVLRGPQVCDSMGPECTSDSRPGATVSECLTPEQLEGAPDRFYCPVSLDIMTDPVLLVCTGQTYDYGSLMSWFESGGRNCPMTGLHLSGKVTLKVDVALRDEINAWLRAQGKNPDAIRKAVLLARHGENTDEYGDRIVGRRRKRRRHALRRAVFSKLVNFLTTNCRQYAEIF